MTAPTAPRTRRRPIRQHSLDRADSSAADATADKVARVYEELRALMVSWQLPPGVRIVERSVVTRMGTSRTPVRSALHRLMQEGFVASVGRAGHQRLIVAPLTPGDGREVFLIVGHLEGLAAREAAVLPPARRKALARLLHGINRSLAAEARVRGTPSSLFNLDYAFHQAYVENVAGPRLVALYRAIKPQVERYARLYVSVLLDQLPTSVKEHDAVIKAIASGNPDAAQYAAETNWRNAAERLMRVMAENGTHGFWHYGLENRSRILSAV